MIPSSILFYCEIFQSVASIRGRMLNYKQKMIGEKRLWPAYVYFRRDRDMPRIISEVGVSAEILKGNLLNTNNDYNNLVPETTPLHFGFKTKGLFRPK